MNKLKDYGQVMMIFILLLPVLLGLLGLSLDIGLLFYQQEKLQNAVDLAALSAAHELPGRNHGQVVETAIHFAMQNGIKERSSIHVNYPYVDDPNKLELTAKQKVNFAFLPVLGIKNKQITAEAVAGVEFKTETSLTFKQLDYAVFSGSTTINIDIKGTGSVIKGNIHGNKNVNFHGTKHTVNGNLEASGGKIGGKAGATINGIIDTASPVLPMPSIGFDQLAAQADQIFNQDMIFNNINIDGIWLINGNVKLNGGRVTGKGIILATGSIDLPTNSVEYSSLNDSLALYSLGNITLSCTKNNINGILYAPNGEIRINGSNNTFYGALIADTIIWATNDTVINGDYDIRAPQAFTTHSKRYLLYK